MILQALNDYYQRKETEVDTALPPFGFERVPIEFVLLLDPDGGLIDINDNREQIGRKWVGRAYVVPQAVKRSSGVAANLLWDNAGYVLGIDGKGNPERAAQQHTAFQHHAARAIRLFAEEMLERTVGDGEVFLGDLASPVGRAVELAG